MEAQAATQLPSLPQVLIDLLDAIRVENADTAVLAGIVHNDAAICARLIEAANSSFYGRPKRCETAERAIHSLGTDAVTTIVITASIKQFYSAFGEEHRTFLADFWRRSLLVAKLASTLATLTRYELPEEAYLGGILAGVGRLALLLRGGERYIALHGGVETPQSLLAGENAMFGQDHVSLGADLFAEWQLSDDLVGAIRKQFCTAAEISNEPALAKLLNVATALVENEMVSDDALEKTHRLFNLNESLVLTIRRRVQSEVADLSACLGISIGQQEDGQLESRFDAASIEIGRRLDSVGTMKPISAGLWQARSEAGLREAINRALLLTLGIERSALCLLDDGSHLVADVKGIDGLSILPMVVGDSLTANALIERAPRGSGDDRSALSAVERQLLDWSGKKSFCAWPLISDSQPLGVLLIFGEPWSSNKVLENPGPLKVVCDEIGRFVAANRKVAEPVDIAQETDPAFQLEMEEAVARSANPAAIVNKYLEELRAGMDSLRGDEYDILKEEIERVGQVLLRLRSLDVKEELAPTFDLNAVITATVDIFRRAIFLSRGIEIRLELDPEAPRLGVDAAALRQILSNLLSNAGEAMPDGGLITVRTEAAVYLAGAEYVDVTVRDNGPGIPPEIKRHLFKPMTSPKGADHAGLGLSIVKQLVDEMQGSIMCRSHGGADSGTEFQVLLPIPAA